jgi:anti-sigma regulatory factor (Ser/Thr protein kinase)
MVVARDVTDLSMVRAFVAEQARGHLSDVFGAVLLTSELVTNVVRHARTDATVRVVVGPPFRVEVHDGAAATDAFRELIAESPMVQAAKVDGRGLAVLHHMAARVGLEDDPDGGKVVWFEM